MPRKRSLPKLPETEVPHGFASLLAFGFDSVEETFYWRIHKSIADYLTWAQEQAKDRDPEGGEGVYEIGIGAEPLAVRPGGAKGATWVAGNDDLLFLFRREGHLWGCTVRYLSAGLWEHGHKALKERARDTLRAAGQMLSSDPAHLGRADIAFDWYSPTMTREMVPALTGQVVAHSSVKVRGHLKLDPVEVDMWCKAGRMETMTIGPRSPLEVQIYDKGREIKEGSKKEWMKALWEREGFYPPEDENPVRDVWRLEIRFKKDHLRERNIETMEQFMKHRRELLSEILYSRRLVQPTSDTNRRRWPLHPLWWLAAQASGRADPVPLGRQITGRREVVVENLVKQAAGTLRAGLVAKHEYFTWEHAEAFMEEVRRTMKFDSEGGTKDRKLRDRYLRLDEAT